MLRLIISGFLLSLLFSCNNKTTDLEKNSVRVTYKDLEPSDKVLELAGMELCDRFEIEIYSDRTFYSIFVAYYSIDNEKSYNEVTLLDYQILVHSAFNQEKLIRGKNELVYDKVGGLFRVDKKANVLLHNDSLYYSIFDDFLTAPIEIQYINNSTFGDGVTKKYLDTEVIGLFRQDFDPIGTSNLNSDCEYYMFVGLALSDKPGDLDFKKMLDSENVKLYLPRLIYHTDYHEKFPQLVPITDSFYVSK
jgi:hypothetical protein